MTKLTDPDTSPPSSSTGSNRAVPNPPPSDPLPHTDPQQEIKWQTSLKDLEHILASYRECAREGRATEQDAETLAKAMETVGGSHTDPKVKNYWEQYAKKFREADPEERDGILEGIAKGLLILLTSPFYVVGAALLAAGLILDGVGFALKSVGRLVKKITFWGGSTQRSSASTDATPKKQ